MQPEILLKKINKEFPKLIWKNFKFIKSGWDFDIIILDNKIVFRFPKKHESIMDLKKEIILLKYLSPRVSVDIPKYIYTTKTNSFGGYKFLQGNKLSISKYKYCSLKEKSLIQNDIAKFLSTLHNTPKSKIKKMKTRVGHPGQFLTWLKNDTRKFVFPKLNIKEINAINKHFDNLQQSLTNTYKPVLIHGDMGESNTLLDNKTNKLSIIDFSDHHFGDPANDFSGLYKYGKKFVKNIYNLYQGPKDNNFLYRAKLNYMSSPLTTMKGALCGSPENFKTSYSIFKKRFKII